MLKNTLIVPETDAVLAAQMIQDAIEALDVILMFIFGTSGEAKKAVEWSDKLCEKTRVSETRNMRKVVWVRDPEQKPIRKILDPIIGKGKTPLVVVLNFYDKKKGEIPAGGKINPLALEALFLKGHES